MEEDTLNQTRFTGTITLNRILLNCGIISSVLYALMMMINHEGYDLASQTPWVGVRERIYILACLIWIAVLAILLLRKIQETQKAIIKPQIAV
jgi:uncharacterized membrane protein